MSMQQISFAAAIRSRRQEHRGREELLADLRALRALARRARLRHRCAPPAPHRRQLFARVLTILTILALASPTSSSYHQFLRLHPLDILASISSATTATITSTSATAASLLTYFALICPVFAFACQTIITPLSLPTTSITATITPIIPADPKKNLKQASSAASVTAEETVTEVATASAAAAGVRVASVQSPQRAASTFTPTACSSFVPSAVRIAAASRRAATSSVDAEQCRDKNSTAP